MAAYLLIGLAAACPPAGLSLRGKRRDPVLFIYVPVVVGGALVALRLARGGLDAFASWCLLAVLMFVVIRQVLARRENRQLTARLEAQVRTRTHQALHDPLTGLANRTLFIDRVDHELARARRGGAELAVLFVDLDDFKPVNDTLGHTAGDELLREIATRLAAAVRAEDTVARLGGDEFGILLAGSDEPAAAEAVERIERALGPPVLLADTEMSITASIGIVLGGASTNSVTELLEHADSAMYSAKVRRQRCRERFHADDARDALAGQDGAVSCLA